ncbi:hypothetical protein DEEACLCL_00003 [Salmonella phage CRW-SP2]|nr:hypothetical protein DEEACLCL_00003 [Salmonella phage CRW-SP2]
MKYFVGLYAVGEDDSDMSNIVSLFDNTTAKKAIYIHCLYCTKEFQVSPHLVLPLLRGSEKGLYIGIVEQSSTLGAKVIPVKQENQAVIDSILPKEVTEKIYTTMGVLFGADSSGEATPEYVDQDR